MERLPPPVSPTWEGWEGGGEEGGRCASFDEALGCLSLGPAVEMVAGETVWVPESCVFFPSSTSLYNNTVTSVFSYHTCQACIFHCISERR